MAAVDSRHAHFSSSPISRIEYLPPVTQYHDDFAAAIQDRNNSFCDNEADNDDEDDLDLPLIEEVLNPDSRYNIPTRDYNIGHNSQNPDKLVLDTNKSGISPKQSRSDNNERHEHGTKDRPVILEDDEPDIADLQATDVSTGEPSGRDIWYDLEDDRYIDKDGCPIPQPRLDDTVSACVPAQSSLGSHIRSPELPEDQSSPYGNDKTVPNISSDRTRQSSAAHLKEKCEEKTEKDRLDELEQDLLLAFEEQEKLSPAASISSLQPAQHGAELPQTQINQEDHQSRIVDGTLEELGQNSPLSDQRQEDRTRQNREQQEEVQTKSQPTTEFETGKHRFRIRGIRTLRLSGCQTQTTQYLVVWGDHPNRCKAWVKEDEIQICLLQSPQKRMDNVRLNKMRQKQDSEDGKTFEYLLDQQRIWIPEERLRYLFNPALLTTLLASSSDHPSEAKSTIDLTYSATLISGERNNLRTSRSPSSLSAPLGPAPGDGLKLQKREKRRKHPDPDDETSSDGQHSVHGKHDHDSCDATDDEDPRPAKRRKPRLETSTALAIYLEHSVEPRIGQPRTLAASSVVRPQMDGMQAETESGCPSTALDSGYESVPRTSRSLSAVREPGPVATSQEWFVQGVLKCTMVGCEAAFNLEFRLPDISGPLDLPINPLGVTFNSDQLAHTARVLRRYTTSQVLQGKTTTAAAHKPNRDNDRDVCSGGDSNESEQQTWNAGRHAQWSAKDEQRLLAFREEGKSWDWIFSQFPGRTQGAVRTRLTIARKKAATAQAKSRRSSGPTSQPKPRRDRPRKPINPLDMSSITRIPSVPEEEEEEEFTDINEPVGPLDIYDTRAEWQMEEIPWTGEEDIMVVQLKEAGYTRAEIREVMPHRSDDAIHKRYSTKLKKKREQTLRRRRQLLGNR